MIKQILEEAAKETEIPIGMRERILRFIRSVLKQRNTKEKEELKQ